VDVFRRLADSKIRKAMESGEFDRLPGRGRPLPPDEFAHVAAELRMGFRVLRNSDCLPPELEARKEVARLGSLLDAAADPEERRSLSRLRADAELRYQLMRERRAG
jgi:Domain of unknown function (DUF1992)